MMIVIDVPENARMLIFDVNHGIHLAIIEEIPNSQSTPRITTARPVPSTGGTTSNFFPSKL